MAPNVGRPKIGTAVFLLRDNYVALTERRGKLGNGLLGLAGGKPEGSESPAQGVLREALEETGLVIPPSELTELDYHSYVRFNEGRATRFEIEPFDTHFVELFFYYRLHPDQVIQNLEPEKHGPWRWYPLHSLTKGYVYTDDARKESKPLFPGLGTATAALIEELRRG